MEARRWLMVLIVVNVLLSLASFSMAIDGKSNQATLRGLKGVGVLVEKLPSEVEQGGLKRGQLQMEVESKLRRRELRF